MLDSNPHDEYHDEMKSLEMDHKPILAWEEARWRLKIVSIW